MSGLGAYTLSVIYDDPRLHDHPVSRATTDSAGYDLRACIDNDTVIYPGETLLISSGLRIDLRSIGPSHHNGWAALILPRSGLGHKHGIVLGNTVGLIDADYQDVIKVSLYNRSSTAYLISPMDRIAQMIIIPVATPVISVVSDFVSQSDRGGFGSTGNS